jgi:hypothetical protein
MKLTAIQAYPGKKYLDPAGNTLEPALDIIALRAKGEIKLRRDDGILIFYRLDGRGARLKNPDGKIRIFEYPDNHKLDDGTRPGKPRPGKPGPRPRGIQKWWGWSFTNPEICEALLEKVVLYGGFVVPTHHYFRIGFQGITFASLFRNGMLGFTEVPEELSRYAIERGDGGGVPVRGYRDTRIILEAVVILRQQREFVLGFVSAFRRFSSKLSVGVKR